MANGPYVLWIIAINAVILCMFLASHLLLRGADPAPSQLMQAINGRSLPFFIVVISLFSKNNIEIYKHLYRYNTAKFHFQLQRMYE